MFGKPQFQELTRVAGLYMKEVIPKGRGLFCGNPIKKGDVIEIVPGLLFNEEDAPHIRETAAAEYYFKIPADLPKDLAQRFKIRDVEKCVGLAMGAMSYCNHMMDPNAVQECLADRHSLFYVLKALRDIPADTEISINYGVSWLETHKRKF